MVTAWVCPGHQGPTGWAWGGTPRGREGETAGTCHLAEGLGSGGQVMPGEGRGRAVTLKKASSKTSRGPEKPTTSSGWAPSREKRTPSTAVDTISSDTPINPSVFSPRTRKGQWDGPGLARTWPLFLI